MKYTKGFFTISEMKRRLKEKMEEAKRLQRSGDLSRYLMTLFEAEKISDQLSHSFSVSNISYN